MSRDTKYYCEEHAPRSAVETNKDTECDYMYCKDDAEYKVGKPEKPEPKPDKF